VTAFIQRAQQALTLLGPEARATNGETVLQLIAQDEGVAGPLARTALLLGDRWAAVAVVQGPDGQITPTLFWEASPGAPQVNGLDLSAQVVEPNGAPGLRSGRLLGALGEEGGAIWVLLVSAPQENSPEAQAYVVRLAPDGATRTWRGQDDPAWSVHTTAASLSLDPAGDPLLPGLQATAPLAPDSPLRQELAAATIFVEEPPFAQQLVRSRWLPLTRGTGADTRLVYTLQERALLSTPLTTLVHFLLTLQKGDLDAARTFAIDPTLPEAAQGMGLAAPGIWFAQYLGEQGEPTPPGTITAHLRFFDNGDRNRTFDAFFEQDGQGVYRLLALSPGLPFTAADLVTPLPVATDTPTVTPTPTDTSTATATATAPPETPVTEDEGPTTEAAEPATATFT
ncbi:MAG: hypothetical protein D6790_19310, partial [Caldilineae bacterium]